MRESVKTTKHIAKVLRNNMTWQENRLWYEFLCKLNIRVRRQHRIGRYVVDFYCERAKVVIELDGSQHYEGSQYYKDKERDREIELKGIIVLRYSNKEIEEAFESVCENIKEILQKRIGEKVYDKTELLSNT